MDPIIQLLITKYGLPPETAKSFAAKIMLGNDPESSAMRGEAAQMQTQMALNTMRANEAQMAQMKSFQQSDPVTAQLLQRAGQVMAEGTRQARVLGTIDQNNRNPEPYPDSSQFDQAGYDKQMASDKDATDRASYDYKASRGYLDHYTQESMPDAPDDETLQAMRKDYLASSRPGMDDSMRQAYLKAAAKSPKHMVVRLADTGE